MHRVNFKVRHFNAPHIAQNLCLSMYNTHYKYIYFISTYIFLFLFFLLFILPGSGFAVVDTELVEAQKRAAVKAANPLSPDELWIGRFPGPFQRPPTPRPVPALSYFSPQISPPLANVLQPASFSLNRYSADPRSSHFTRNRQLLR